MIISSYYLARLLEREDAEKLDMAYTYLKNKQTTFAYNLFWNLAKKEMNKESYRAGLILMLASECRLQQGKDQHEELLQAAKLYLNLAKKEKSYSAKYAYLCAAKCFLKIGNYEDAMSAYEKTKKITYKVSEEKKPIVIVDDSPSITMKLNSYLQKLGYKNVYTFNNGKEAIQSIKKLIDLSQNPIILLDMELPDVKGDIIAKKLLDSKPDISIILITADEKTAPRVKKTIGWGSAAFVQKPFTIDDLKNALDTTESNMIT